MFEIFVYICLLNDKYLANQSIIENLQKRFKGRAFFTRKELFDFYNEIEPLNESTFRWRIYDLKKGNIIRSLSIGTFTFNLLAEYCPSVSNENKEIHSLLLKQFNSLKHSIWSTQILNEFMLHLPGNKFTILEVEKDALGAVFNFLKANKKIDVFLQPTEKDLEHYVFERRNAIILKQLITKSPLQKINNVPTVTLEKLIVDIYSDKKLFEAFQGSELKYILNNAFKKYSINFTRLLHYAKRRSKKEEIKEYLIQKVGLPKTIFND